MTAATAYKKGVNGAGSNIADIRHPRLLTTSFEEFHSGYPSRRPLCAHDFLWGLSRVSGPIQAETTRLCSDGVDRLERRGRQLARPRVVDRRGDGIQQLRHRRNELRRRKRFHHQNAVWNPHRCPIGCAVSGDVNDRQSRELRAGVPRDVPAGGLSGSQVNVGQERTVWGSRRIEQGHRPFRGRRYLSLEPSIREGVFDQKTDQRIVFHDQHKNYRIFHDFPPDRACRERTGRQVTNGGYVP